VIPGTIYAFVYSCLVYYCFLYTQHFIYCHFVYSMFLPLLAVASHTLLQEKQKLWFWYLYIIWYLDVPWRNTSKIFNKGMQPFGKPNFNNNAANRSKNVE